MKEFKYKINGNQYNVEILKEEDGVVELSVNGTQYAVEIEKTEESKPAPQVKKPAPAPSPVKESGAPVVSQPKSNVAGGAVKSPLPGTILEISVNVGDVVKAGQKLMILEAMKMENVIVSDLSGKVVDIRVRKGDAILEGTDMIIIG